MDNDKRKQYNALYYSKNKDTIKVKLFTKEECKICGRFISHQNVKKHQTTSLCQSNSTKSDLTTLKEEMELLKDELQKMKTNI